MFQEYYRITGDENKEKIRKKQKIMVSELLLYFRFYSYNLKSLFMYNNITELISQGRENQIVFINIQHNTEIDIRLPISDRRLG